MSPQHWKANILGEDYNAFKSDVWAAGILLFSLITGKVPFPNPAKNAWSNDWTLPEFPADRCIIGKDINLDGKSDLEHIVRICI